MAVDFKQFEDLRECPWSIETLRSLDGRCRRWRKVRSDVPDEADEEFYATWIGWYENFYWTPWMIWDVDSSNVEVSLIKTREFIRMLFRLGVKEDALRVVFSTNKGFHIYLDSRAIGLNPSQNLYSELRAFGMAMLPDCDESFYGRRRVVGIPNSIHRKTGLYYVCLERIDYLFEWNVEQLKGYATHPRIFDGWKDGVEVVPILQQKFESALAESKAVKEQRWMTRAQIENALSKPHPFFLGLREGQRNLGMFTLARHYRDLGLAIEEALVLVRYANGCSVPTLSPHDVEKHVRGAYKSGVIQ